MALTDIAAAAYSLVGLGLMAQGLRYLLASRVMHYHTEAMRVRWNELTKSEQRILLGLLRGFGAGMFCLGVAMVFTSIVPLRHGAMFAHWFIAFISIMYTAMLVHITRYALLPGAAPIAVTITMCALCVVASVLSIIAL